MKPSLSNKAVLALGSNEGDRLDNIRRGLVAMEQAKVIKVEAVSSLYESTPFECAGGDFLNAAAKAESLVSARELLNVILKVQTNAGRKGSKTDARPLDIDIIYIGHEQIMEKDLIVPHPRRLERPFVMIPAAEVFAELVDPETGRTVRDEALRFRASSLRLFMGPNWWSKP